MSSNSQISGLVSGLNTADIVASIMKVEAIPQAQLSDKKTELSRVVAALQSLNTKVSSLGDAAAAAADPASWNALKASSTAASVTAAARSTATATEVSFTVDKLAASQVSVSSALSGVNDLTGGASTLTLKVGGTLTEIKTDGLTSIADLASAINSSGAGVSATTVKYTADDGSTAYRLQLTGQTSGSANGFTLYQGDKAAVEGGTATAVGLTTTRTAQDAQVTLWPTSGQSQKVTSSSNTFADLVTGVDVTVTAVETTPVTLGVTQDSNAVAKLGANLVSQLNLVLGEIASRTAATTKTNADGTTSVTGGVLSSNSGVRSLSEQISEAGSYDVDPTSPTTPGVSPSTIGISVDKDGTFSFDSAVFAAALAKDPDKVQATLTSIANRVSKVSTAASDKYEGTLTQEITSDNSQISDLSSKIADWNSVLATRRDAIEAQWASLETSMQTLKSQQSWLTSALGALNGSSSSSSSSSS